MCGIAGLWAPSGLARDAREALVRMTDTLSHRGPDDDGIWVNADAGIALGHRRLSIIDLSPLGHQPMVSADGRYVLVYNGELWNFREIRRRLEVAGIAFRGSSDTEVLLEAIAFWGIDRALADIAGMFAFAVWDRAERTLHLARDRFGEKPLYYGWCNGTLLFASELKALRAHPAFNGELDRVAVAQYFRHNYIPAPRSIYRDIGKLLPAHVTTIRPDGRESRRPYWRLDEAVAGGDDAPARTHGELTTLLDQCLSGTIADQMVADVPLGALLSGGIDSSLVVALMQRQATRPVRTFTIGFREARYNEAGFAREVARHLGTDHLDLFVTPADALALIPRLPSVYDEPFGDSSAIPTMLVAAMARQHVTVAISGDGGDEAFGGYTRYQLTQRIWRLLDPVPQPFRRSVARLITQVPTSQWQSVFDVVQSVVPAERRIAFAGDRMHKLASLLQSARDLDMYHQLVSHWDPLETVVGADEPDGWLGATPPGLAGRPLMERMMFADAQTYLPDDILVKVDRATMAVGLESRSPFLDHRVVEFAWRLPLESRVRGRAGKRILRDLAGRYIPGALIDRPKQGFGTPIDEWLRGPLRGWAEALLDPARLRDEGWLAPAIILRRWEEHLGGGRNWQHHLWGALMFQAWLEHERSPAAAPHDGVLA